MRKLATRSVASRLCALAVLPSALPILVGIYLYDANRLTVEDASSTSSNRAEGIARGRVAAQSLEQTLEPTAFADIRVAPSAIGPEARYGAATANALPVGSPASPAAPGVRADAPVSESLILPAASSVGAIPAPGEQFWQMPAVALLAAAYVAALALSMLGAWELLRRFHRFHNAAEDVASGRVGGNALTGRNDLRELAGVARTVDGLVFDLRNMSHQMRTSAAENSHSLRTPLATIRTAFRTVGRSLPTDEPKAQRALRIIDISLHRLSSVIDAMERNDRAIAESMAMPRETVNVTRLVHESAGALRQIASSRNIRVSEQLQGHVFACTSARALADALRDVLASALDASPADGEIAVTLDGIGVAGACIVIEDRGRGAEDVDSIFEQDFLPSSEAMDAAASCRAGLWQVRRMLEALGGKVSAHRNLRGGLSVSIVLPAIAAC
jgi:signal transduction histidine kinase